MEPFPTEVDLRCGDRGWLEALGGSRHYLYPVHISHTFISCPSVGAALYLLLLRLLARQYDAAARVAPLCVSDATLSAEEAQLVRALADAAEDQHPDAHACRLRLSLAALHTPMYDALPWRLGEQLAGYAAKAAHVSFACRLPPADERQLLDRALAAAEPPPAVALLKRRVKILKRWAPPALGSSPRLDVELAVPLPAAPSVPAFDGIDDRSCVSEGMIDALIGKMTTISYARPEGALVGLPALQNLETWLGHGLELRGGRDDKGFLFLYELMCGHVLFRLLNDDKGHTLGTFLLRMMPPADTQKEGVLMSTLRLLAQPAARAADAQVRGRPPRQDGDDVPRAGGGHQAARARHRGVLRAGARRHARLAAHRLGSLRGERPPRPPAPARCVHAGRARRRGRRAAGAGATGEIDQARRPPARPPVARPRPPARHRLITTERSPDARAPPRRQLHLLSQPSL